MTDKYLDEVRARAEREIVIQHVKWRKAYDVGIIYPAADTDMFSSLLKSNRGRLVFIPAEQDYPAERGDEDRVTSDIPELLDRLAAKEAECLALAADNARLREALEKVSVLCECPDGRALEPTAAHEENCGMRRHQQALALMVPGDEK
jgi:hypothetical protein